MNPATIETLSTLARRASDRASGYAMAGERTHAAQWSKVARSAHEAAKALQDALALE